MTKEASADNRGCASSALSLLDLRLNKVYDYLKLHRYISPDFRVGANITLSYFSYRSISPFLLSQSGPDYKDRACTRVYICYISLTSGVP